MKLLLRRICEDFQPQQWISHHQFGFRQKHSTAQVLSIIQAQENKECGFAIVLDFSQAFDKIWQQELLQIQITPGVLTDSVLGPLLNILHIVFCDMVYQQSQELVV